MPEPAGGDNEISLRRFLEDEAESLLPTLRWYVRRAGLAQGSAALAAAELMSELAVEALAHAGRFQPDRSPRAWLLGIAANLVRRKQSALARLERREPLVNDLAPADPAAPDENELFDRLARLDGLTPEEIVVHDQALGEMLASLPPADRRVIELAVLAGLNGQELAETLGIRPGAARLRLHRALLRLRQTWPSPDRPEPRKVR
jgi:RNA polymerase sigma-70 factor (ECF subfamily)